MYASISTAGKSQTELCRLHHDRVSISSILDDDMTYWRRQPHVVASFFFSEGTDEVHRQRENDGGVLLSGDHVE